MVDRSVELVRQGYQWAQRLRDGATAVPTRLLGRRAAVVGGPDGVRRFYDPDRFLRGDVDGDALVPQGGGDLATGHRCPGERVTLTMLATAVRVLARLPHTLPPQDLTYDLTRVPTLPHSGVVIELDGAATGAPNRARPSGGASRP